MTPPTGPAEPAEHRLRRSPAADRDARNRAWRRRLIPVVLALSLAMLACGPQVGQPDQRSSGAANTLDTNIEVDNLGVDPAVAPQLTVKVAFGGSFGTPIQLTGGQTLACNGVALAFGGAGESASYGEYAAQVPRAAARQGYTLVYTDEHGTQTTFAIPATQGTLAITGLHPDDSLPIPDTAQLSVHYMGVGLEGATARDHITVASTAASDQLSYAADPHTSVAGPYDVTVPSAHLYSAWMKPGPGSLAIQEETDITPPPGGFAVVDLSYLDSVSVPVTWIATE